MDDITRNEYNSENDSQNMEVVEQSQKTNENSSTRKKVKMKDWFVALWANIVHQWPKWRIIKWLSNITCFIAVLLSVTTIVVFSVSVVSSWIGLEKAFYQFNMPPGMETLNLSTAKSLWDDSWARNFDKYHQATVDKITEASCGADNYHLELTYSPYTNLTVNVHENVKINCDLELSVCGDIKKGTFRFAANALVREESFSIPFYQIKEGSTFTTYFQFNNQWYFHSSEDAGLLLGFSPDVAVSMLKEAHFKETPTSHMLLTYSSDIDESIFSFSLPVACDKTPGWSGIIMAYDDYTLQYLYPGSMVQPIDYDALLEFAKENNDTLCQHILETYEVRSMLQMAEFSKYGEIEEIELPDDLATALPVTNAVQEDLQSFARAYLDKNIADYLEQDAKQENGEYTPWDGYSQLVETLNMNPHIYPYEFVFADGYLFMDNLKTWEAAGYAEE